VEPEFNVNQTCSCMVMSVDTTIKVQLKTQQVSSEASHKLNVLTATVGGPIH